MVWLGNIAYGGYCNAYRRLYGASAPRVLKAGRYTIRRSRNSISPDNLGGYMIIDLSSNGVVAGSRYELSLEEVRDWLRICVDWQREAEG